MSEPNDVDLVVDQMSRSGDDSDGGEREVIEVQFDH